jgi:acyl carrier protein
MTIATIPTQERTPLTYDAVVDRIRAGALRAKGVRLAPEDITESTAFWPGDDPSEKCLYLDSLDFLELVMSLEQEHGWVVPETAIDIQDCRTVGGLATVILQHVPQDL